MSWLYSQALVEEYLGENSLDGAQSAPLNGSRTQQAYCAPDKMTDFSRLSRFGMTFKPLTENLGEELLMSYRAGFHAKTSQLLEKGQESMESDQECGEKWRGSFTKYDQDSCSWKTHQCSLLGDLDEFLETWPQWGLMRDGECWEQRTLEQTIRGTGFGLSEKLPTPQASDNRDRGNMSNPSIQRRVAIGKQIMLSQSVDPNSGQLNPTWVEWLMGWPLGWTDLKPLETDKFHCVQQLHGESSQEEPN